MIILPNVSISGATVRSVRCLLSISVLDFYDLVVNKSTPPTATLATVAMVANTLCSVSKTQRTAMTPKKNIMPAR